MAASARLLQCVAFLSLATALCVAASAEPRYEHGISFFHELKYPADFTHFDYLNPDAPKGGVLVRSTQNDFNILTLITDNLVAAPGVSLLYDSLVSHRSEKMSSFYGWLADGLAVSDDKRTLFIRLHPEARWHDGVPITARDVTFTLEFIRTSIWLVGFFSWVQSVEVLSEREIAFRLASELTLSNIFPLSWFPIMPAHYWEDKETRPGPLWNRRWVAVPTGSPRSDGDGISVTSGFPITGDETSPSTRAALTSIRSSTMFIGMRPSPGRRFARDCSIPGSSRTFATGRLGMTFPAGIRAGW